MAAGPLIADESSTKANAENHETAEPEISAPEDLMREHGVLNRILLIYEEGLRRIHAGDGVPPDVFQKPAELVRRFVEDYHERLEEQFIFPAFEKQKKLLDLVAVLRQQHQAGRRLTDDLLRLATPTEFVRPEAKQKVVGVCQAFIRMYRPHEAREDTVLFPALYGVLSAKDVKELGEQFETREHELFGEGGFQETVGKVAELEKQLDIYQLSRFTPK
jgi:hemerythrin-like domain-containing protein